MPAVATNWLELIEHLPKDGECTLYQRTWDDYEELLDEVGEASGLRISYYRGALKIMTLAAKHERYERFFEKLVAAISLALRIEILSFGSATMRKQKGSAGKEPDACFYVQSARLIGYRDNLDFSVDPPPDIALEIDIYHDSLAQFPIYLMLEVPEIWRYDGEKVAIYLLRPGAYVEVTTSQALPFLTAQRLTDLLTQLRTNGEFATLIAFDAWLSTLPRP